MSEIDAARTGPPAANRAWVPSTPASAAAAGTSRRLAPTGLADAFAEVFARMAAPVTPRRSDPRPARPDRPDRPDQRERPDIEGEPANSGLESGLSRGRRPNDAPAGSAVATADSHRPETGDAQPPSSGDADHAAAHRNQRHADRLTANSETTRLSDGRHSPGTPPPETQPKETRGRIESTTAEASPAEAMTSDVDNTSQQVRGETQHDLKRHRSNASAESKAAAAKGTQDAADASAKGRNTEAGAAANVDSDVQRPGDPNDAKSVSSMNERETDPRSRRAAAEPDTNQRGDAGMNGKRLAARTAGDASPLPQATPTAAIDGGREATAAQPPTVHTAGSAPAAAVSDSRAVSGRLAASNGPNAVAGKPMGRGTATQPTFSIHDASRPAAESASPGRGDSAGPAAGGKEIVSRVKLIQRVSRAFQQLGRNGGTVRMRLAPAELGTVRIEMRVQDNQVSARVVAETDAASQALREHLPDLRLRLESQGMRVERIEVQTESGEPRDARDQEHANRDHGRQQMGDDPRHRQARRPQGGPEAAVRGTGDDVSRAVSRGGAAAPKNASVSGGVDARF